MWAQIFLITNKDEKENEKRNGGRVPDIGSGEEKMRLTTLIRNLRIRYFLRSGAQNGRFFGELFYVNSPQTLPPPLKKEDEEKYIRLAGQGDRSARDMLIVHNLRLVVYIAKKFENTGAGIEDLVSIGTIGLIKAVNSFDGDKNIKLATYASRCVENEILMFLRKTSNTRTDVSLDEPLNVDREGNELLLSDVLADDRGDIGDSVESEDDIRLVMRTLNALPPRDRRIIEMRFGLAGYREYTQKEVADEMGISQSYISRLEKRIIARMRETLGKF